MSDKYQYKIYKIDEVHCQENLKETIDDIIDNYNSREDVSDEENFKRQSLEEDSAGVFNHFDVEVYFQKKTRKQDLIETISDIIMEGEDIIGAENTYSATVIFLFNEFLFAICGGQGNFLIQDYVDKNFGIDVLTRIHDKTNQAIKNAGERELTGSVFSVQKHYRNKVSFDQEEEFGRFFRQLETAVPSPDIQRYFGINIDIDRGVSCNAKSYFQIRKSITKKELNNVLKEMENLMVDQEKNFHINHVKRLSKRTKKDKNLIKKLNNTLIENIKEYLSGDINHLDLEICNEDFQRYLNAHKYCIKQKYDKSATAETEELTDIYDFKKVIDSGDLELSSWSDDGVDDELRGLKIESFDDENERLTNGKFADHINGLIEPEDEDESFFLMDGEWYRVEEEFLTKTEEKAKNYIDPDIRVEI